MLTSCSYGMLTSCSYGMLLGSAVYYVLRMLTSCSYGMLLGSAVYYYCLLIGVALVAASDLNIWILELKSE